MNFVLQISPKCGQGGEGVKKSLNCVDVIYGWPLTASHLDRSATHFQLHTSEDKNARRKFRVAIHSPYSLISVLIMF